MPTQHMKVIVPRTLFTPFCVFFLSQMTVVRPSHFPFPAQDNDTWIGRRSDALRNLCRIPTHSSQIRKVTRNRNTEFLLEEARMNAQRDSGPKFLHKHSRRVKSRFTQLLITLDRLRKVAAA